MAYLEPSEYMAHGLSAETSDAWIAAASSMMEAHCRRASLLSTSYTERLRVQKHSGAVQLTYGPVTSVHAVQARYGVQMDHGWAPLSEYALCLGLPGQWITVDPASVRLDIVTGEAMLPANLMGLRYSDVEITYSAGLGEVPPAVKFACAQIVKNAQATPGLNVRSSKLDTLQTEYFSDALLDSQVKALLRPYVAERLS